MEVELLVHNETQLGEGPVWDHRSDTLYWVDIEKGHVQAYHYHSGENTVYPMGQYTGAAVPAKDGRLVVALQNKVVMFNPADSATVSLCEPEPGANTNRFNDGKCDPAGRFWIGSTQIDHAEPTGVLYCIEPDGSFSPKLHHLLISNGMAWSSSADTLYFIDSPTLKVKAYHYDQATAKIRFRGEVLTFKGDSGVPDGMCIDMEGHLWIAFYGGSKVACFHPDTGREIAVVEVPAKNTTSCCFGGPGMDELFVTTAKRDDPQGGGLYRCKPGISGPHASFFSMSG